MESWREELYHHGILGQKWGVRRYQNYDGTYTRRGLEHYKKSAEKYQNAKAVRKVAQLGRKQGKLTNPNTGEEYSVQISKNVIKEAKKEEKAAKAAMKKNYNQLKQDYKADHGKELYARGVRITSNEQNAVIREAAVGIASVAARKLLEKKGDVYVKGVGTMADRKSHV